MRLQGLERSGAVGERVKPGAHPKLTKPMPTRADEHVRSPLTPRHGSRRAVCVCTRTHVTVASGGPSPHPGTCGAHCARWGARQPDVPGGLHQRGEALVGQRLPAVGRTRARHILPAASSEQPAAPQDVLAPRAVWLHRRPPCLRDALKTFLGLDCKAMRFIFYTRVVNSSFSSRTSNAESMTLRHVVVRSCRTRDPGCRNPRKFLSTTQPEIQ